ATASKDSTQAPCGGAVSGATVDGGGESEISSETAHSGCMASGGSNPNVLSSETAGDPMPISGGLEGMTSSSTASGGLNVATANAHEKEAATMSSGEHDTRASHGVCTVASSGTIGGSANHGTIALPSGGTFERDSSNNLGSKASDLDPPERL